MRPASRAGWMLMPIALGLAAGGCRLQRPDIVPGRMIEPQLLEATPPAAATPTTVTVDVRLFDTQARDHIGRPLLRLRPNGELVEDPIWRWSSAPARYLDTAVRLVGTSSTAVRFVDSSAAPSLSMTLLAWHLEPADATAGERLVGVVELHVTRTDRTVETQLVRGGEPVSSDLPGNLAVAAGRLLRDLASQSLQVVLSRQVQGMVLMERGLEAGRP